MLVWRWCELSSPLNLVSQSITRLPWQSLYRYTITYCHYRPLFTSPPPPLPPPPLPPPLPPQSHHLLRWCPGVNCSIVFQVKENLPKRVTCSTCTTSCWYVCSVSEDITAMSQYSSMTSYICHSVYYSSLSVEGCSLGVYCQCIPVYMYMYVYVHMYNNMFHCLFGCKALQIHVCMI